MSVWGLCRTLLLVLASLGYLANGAQAHVHISAGETLDLAMCGAGTGSTRSISMEIPGDPAEETDETACGSCVSAPGIIAFATPMAVPSLAFSRPAAMREPAKVSPRSPLWPGAPPHGPPAPLKA